jgi:hypothetical protein
VSKLSKTEKPSVQLPAPELLETWAVKEWKDGVQVDQFEGLETLSVETLHHTYEMTVIDPGTAEVLVRGGAFFPKRILAHLSGASLGGSFLKLHGIYVGFRIELMAGRKRITTSPVRRISVLEH